MVGLPHLKNELSLRNSDSISRCCNDSLPYLGAIIWRVQIRVKLERQFSRLDSIREKIGLILLLRSRFWPVLKFSSFYVLHRRRRLTRK